MSPDGQAEDTQPVGTPVEAGILGEDIPAAAGTLAVDIHPAEAGNLVEGSRPAGEDSHPAEEGSRPAGEGNRPAGKGTHAEAGKNLLRVRVQVD